MTSIRKRLNVRRRRTGFVPSKPWTPKPTFTELMQRIRENARSDVKTLLPVHRALAQMQEGFREMALLPVFSPRTQSWAKELRERLMAQTNQSASRPLSIAVSTPVAKDDAFDRMFIGTGQSTWKTEEQTDPFMEKLAEVLRSFKAQPTDHLILPPSMYDALGKSTSQPVMTFADGQAITLGVDVGRGWDETAGMVVRRHPNGDVEILKRFTVKREGG